jgi:hydroxymethylpyrimidine/phosphomethylpyrimidine kinase
LGHVEQLGSLGDALLRPDAVDALRTLLVPLATIITPNVPEAEGLLGREISHDEPDVDAVRELAALGCDWAYLKGGHLKSDESVDLVSDGSEVIRLSAPRVATEHTHGTGCTLSAALAAYLAKGMSVPDACHEAKRFVTRAIERHLEIGRGIGPVNPAWGLS